MINVLHILWDASIGGIQRLVIQLARQQQLLEGIQPHILLLREGGPLLDEMKAVTEVTELGMKKGLDISKEKYRTMMAAMKGADVLHMHAYHPLAAWTASRSGTPVLYMVHGFEILNPSRREKVNRKLMSRYLRNGVDLVVSVSDFTKTLAEQHYGLDGSNSVSVPNGVDVSMIRERAGDPAASPVYQEGTFTFGTVTRLVDRKRVDLLLRAYALFYSGQDARLVILGDGPDRAALETLAQELGIAGAVEFAGFVTDIERYYAAFDVSVFPFTYEWFGLVAIESYALGIPALVFEDGGGITEIVRGIRSGDICKDTGALAERMKYCLEHREELEAAKPAIRSYADGYGMPTYARRIKAAYDEILGKR